MKPRIGIVGVGGYTGQELWRILLGHPKVDVCLLVSDRLIGATSHEVLGGPLNAASRVSVVGREVLDTLTSDTIDLVFMATPADSKRILVA